MKKKKMSIQLDDMAIQCDVATCQLQSYKLSIVEIKAGVAILRRKR